MPSAPLLLPALDRALACHVPRCGFNLTDDGKDTGGASHDTGRGSDNTGGGSHNTGRGSHDTGGTSHNTGGASDNTGEASDNTGGTSHASLLIASLGLLAVEALLSSGQLSPAELGPSAALAAALRLVAAPLPPLPVADDGRWLGRAQVRVITISRGCYERCCSNKKTPPYHSKN